MNNFWTKADGLRIRTCLLDYRNSQTSESGLDLELEMIIFSAYSVNLDPVLIWVSTIHCAWAMIQNPFQSEISYSEIKHLSGRKFCIDVRTETVRIGGWDHSKTPIREHEHEAFFFIEKQNYCAKYFVKRNLYFIRSVA